MDWTSFFQFGLALFILVIKPGPGLFAFIVHTLRNGWKHSYAFASGVATTEVFYFLLAATGYAVIAAEFQDFLKILFQTVGAVILIYLGIIGFVKKDPENSDEEVIESKPIKEFFRSYMIGFTLTLGNPLAIVFYLSLMPTFFGEYIGQTQMLVQGTAAVLIFEILPYFIATPILLYFGKSLSDKALSIMNIVTSTLMIALGVFMGLSTFQFISLQNLYF